MWPVFVSTCLLGGQASAADADIEITRIEREWRYLAQRATLALGSLGERPELKTIISRAKEVRDKCSAKDPALIANREQLREQRTTLSARVLKLLHPETDLLASFADPYERLTPDVVPSGEPVTVCQIAGLPTEYQAAGVLLANTTASPMECHITLSGFPPELGTFTVRQQAFVEEYYRRAKERLADPLVLLPKEEAWACRVPAGDTVKLYVGVQLSSQAKGPAKGSIAIRTSTGRTVRLLLTIRVLPAPAPRPDRFQYLAFMRNVATRSPGMSARDLAEHGVTMMSFTPHLPKAKFTRQGQIAAVDFSKYDRFLKAYAPHIKRMLIIWQAYPYDRFECTDGAVLDPDSDVWAQALANLLRAWADHVADAGYGPERFINGVFDEPSGKRALRAAELFELGRQALPDVPVSLTLCDYASAADLRVMLPHVGLTMVGLPFRTSLPRHKVASWSKRFPLDYNPREAYHKTIYPMLTSQREKTGMELMSYHVSHGKRDNVLLWNRTYPILAVAAGLTGAAHWAYNDIQGTTWGHNDGRRKRPDYVFVYDGTEDHPLNHRLNPTREAIVPSIRWEAVRAGLQDARVMLSLRDLVSSGKCPAALGKDIEALFDSIGRLAVKSGESQIPAVSLLGPHDGQDAALEPITPAAVERVSQRLRVLYGLTKR